MAYTDTEDLNYRGELYLIGANQTPFLSMIGGLNVGKRTNSFQFPLGQTYALSAASQNVQTETVSAAAGTATTITRSEDTNTVQLMKYDVAVTFAKIGDSMLADPNIEEEDVMTARLTVTTKDDGHICALQKGGTEGLTVEEIKNAFNISIKKGKEIRKMIS